MDIKSQCVEAYGKHKHLKLAADEVGIPWQTVYVYLKEMDVAVTGDKSRYGSAKDRLASYGENLFKQLVPAAIDNNKSQFQAKLDFNVFEYGVDVKTAILARSSKRHPGKRWAFSLKKQEMLADFAVLFALTLEKEIDKCFLLPGELIRSYQTISIPESLNSKWADYAVDPNCLSSFFESLPIKRS